MNKTQRKMMKKRPFSTKRIQRQYGLESLESRVVLAAQPIISEFMADNDGSILDGDGRRSDWIEIYNAGDESINLAGYHLTDNLALPSKWTFPDVELPAGQFHVVFASSPIDIDGNTLDNYVDADGNLHANFSLNSNGEYLALVEPDGTTIASEFSPEYPAQFPGISYGVEQMLAFDTLVESGSPATLLIPTIEDDQRFGSTWSGGSEPFDDTSWRNVENGIGYDVNAVSTELTNVALGKPVSQSSNGFGFNGRLAVDGDKTGNSISHTETGDLHPWIEIDLEEDFALERINVYTRENCCTPNSPERDYNLTVEVRDENDNVIFTNPVFNAWDGEGDEANDITNGTAFTVDLTGEAGEGLLGRKVRISKQAFAGSEWMHFAEIEVDARITETTVETENIALGKPTTGGVAFNSPTSNGVDGNLGNFTHTENVGEVFWQVDLERSSDLERIELVNRTDCCAERLDGAILSVLDQNQEAIFTADPISRASAGETFEFDNDGRGFQNARYIRVDHRDEYLSIAELLAFSSTGLASFINSDVQESMHNVNPSAYVRIPFDLTDASSYDQLMLDMGYDDGFVAYVNGIEVIRMNAPVGVPNFNAAATGETNSNFQSFQIDHSLLKIGKNILAIHGLNVSADDGDFLVSPTLVGRRLPTGSAGYLLHPTPNEPNKNKVDGFVQDTSFSVNRGFYDEPFELEISTNTRGATIVYTTDGSPPSLENGTMVNAANDESIPVAKVNIETTTTLRAAAFKEGFEPTNIDTQSYFFLNDVIRQPSEPEGLPTDWDGIAQPSVRADYEMDPEVVDDPLYKDEIIDGLKSIRTISIVMDPADLFGQERGIYINSGQRGRDWEHATSVEIIETDGTTFQVDSGIRIHGFSWRFHANTPKHSFRLEFRDEFGPSKLEYPLFPDAPVKRFDSIVLRAQGGRSWGGLQEPRQSQYLRDTFARDLAHQMGAVDGHATLVHLYLNGLYWGLYNPVERPDAQMGEEYFGGADEDYDAINRRTSTSDAIDGDLVRYNEMISIADDALRAGVTTDEQYEQLKRYVAINDFIDWFLRNQYVTNRDGITAFDGNNMRAIGSRVGDAQFHFFVWDMEYSMWNATDNNNVEPGANDPALAGSQNPPRHAWSVYNALRQHPEFRLLYADRAHKHLFNDGALTPEKAAATWEVRAESIETAIIGESARWGDARRAQPYTRDVEWQDERERLLNEYFPFRTGVLVEDLTEANLYPEVAAPRFLIDGTPQHGGSITADAQISMTHQSAVPVIDNGLIDGNSQVSFHIPTSNLLNNDWRELAFVEGQAGEAWQQGPNGIGYDSRSEYDPFININVEEQMRGVQPTVYIRVPFSVPDQATIDAFDFLTLRMLIDDGFIAYLNGHEISSFNLDADEEITWNTSADGAREADLDKPLDFDVTEFMQHLVVGENLLAIHGMNSSPSSNDLLIHAELIGQTIDLNAPQDEVWYTTDGSDPRLPGGAVNSVENGGTAQLYSTDLNVGTTTQLRARALTSGGQWSALNDALFVVGTPLRITEINYNPRNPTQAEIAISPEWTANDFEFVEVKNIGDAAMNIADVQIVNGIEMTFPSHVLQSGEFGVIVSNQEAFEIRYGADLNVIGEFSGSLRNSGERLTMLDPLGNVVLDFEYSDDVVWPQRADGAGGTLELINVTTPEDQYGKYYRWRGSSLYGGSPGSQNGERIGIVINEVSARNDAPAAGTDSIELRNTTTKSIDIGGWYLSDSDVALLKYRIPNDVVVEPGGFVVFDESDFNPTPANPEARHFGLSGSRGDDVWLVIANDMGEVVQFVDDVHFGSSVAVESFGRVDEDLSLVAPMPFSFGSSNSDPRIGPVIISEIYYNPGVPSAQALAIYPALVSNDLEFLEIHNSTNEPINLVDWQIRGGVDFDFSNQTTLRAGETLIVTSFDPNAANNVGRAAAFKSHFGLDLNVSIVGGYSGQLKNDGERVSLFRPDQPPADDPTFIPRLAEDEVVYDDRTPWMTASGDISLHRVDVTSFGNRAGSWVASVTTPGVVEFISGDLNNDGVLNVDDVDLLCGGLRSGDLIADLNADGVSNHDDLKLMIESVFRTNFGDANLDGIFNSRDLVNVFRAGEYEDAQVANSTWSEGDWNCDADFTSSDLVLALQSNGYVMEAADSRIAGAVDTGRDLLRNGRDVATRDKLIGNANESLDRAVQLESHLIDRLFSS